MRIVTGSLRGRRIPVSSSRQGDIGVTPGRLKEAVFGRLGPALEGVAFLDLCAGSGQMALEAYSRGARVTAVEPDRRRREVLRRLMESWGVNHLELLGGRAQTALRKLAAEGRRFDVIYLDPPYRALHNGRPLSQVLLAAAGRSGILAEDGLLLVQHPKGLDLPESPQGLRRVDARRHGTTGLSEYRPAPLTTYMPELS